DDSLHRNDPAHLQSIAKDNQNPVIFSLLVNDSFMSFREFEYAGKTYKKDRGYSFERNLNQNIGDVLNKKLSDYRVPEEEGLIPTMLLSPTIANDGRKLYVTSRPFSFMNTSGNGDNSQMRGVDFYRLFEKQDAQDISFMSALRMSASFPYITPTISLPSKPQMEIMDAGIADNFGVSDALRFLYVFRNWIKENTSGVVLVQIRDNEPNERIHSRPIPSIVDRLTYPIASVYNNLANIQDRNNDVRLEQAKEWLGGNFETFSLIYDTSEDESEQERASLSWHLTTIEKESIIGSIQSKKNKKALNELRALFHSE
ncbi:MAG: patatin-like phospholipase family protein, partial [Cyclobacteriaceae bacterium]